MGSFLRIATLAALAVAALAPPPAAAGVGCVATYDLPCRIVCLEGERLTVFAQGSVTFGGSADCGGAYTGCEVVNRPGIIACSTTFGDVVEYTDVGICRATHPGSTVTCTVS